MGERRKRVALRKSRSGVFIPPWVGIGDVPFLSPPLGQDPLFSAFSSLFGSSRTVMASGA